MLNAYLDDFDVLFPGVKQAYNGKAFYVWSPGDPHILGAYSYLKVGQYTAFNGIQGRSRGEPALRRRAYVDQLPGLCRRRPAKRLPLRKRGG